jgi:hypothetical protein
MLLATLKRKKIKGKVTTQAKKLFSSKSKIINSSGVKKKSSVIRSLKDIDSNSTKESETDDLDDIELEKMQADADAYYLELDEVISEKTVVDISFVPNNESRVNNDINQAIHDLVNIEVNKEYLSEERLKNWASIRTTAQKFERVLIFVSIERGVHKTLGLTQSEYFEKHFDLEPTYVSRSYHGTSALVYLYIGAESLSQISDLNQLLDIGDENDHVASTYYKLIKDYGPKHTIDVFNQCSLLLNENKESRVTASLIHKVSDVFISKKKVEEHYKGAGEPYNIVNFEDILSTSKQKGEVNKTSDTRPLEIALVLTELESQQALLEKIRVGQDKFIQEDINKLNAAIAKLASTAEELESK